MSLRKYPRNGILYLRGTIKAGKKSRSIYESSGIREGDANSKERFNTYRIKREAEILDELIYGKKATVTWTQAAASYCERRHKRLVAQGRDPEAPDEEAARVLEITDFFRARGCADRPLKDLTRTDVDAYFEWRHLSRGNKLVTAKRGESSYCCVMNIAVREGWIDPNYPRPSLPDYDYFAKPIIGKWLYPEEVMMFVDLAPPHLRPLVATLFGTGRRGGELPFISRRWPDYDDQQGTGLCLDEGREHIYLGRTKNGEPKLVSLSDWVVIEIKSWLEKRTDDHDALFLTDKGKPYKRPRRQRGGLFKTAWNRLRRRVAAELLLMAREQPLQSSARRKLIERSHILRRATPHWGRHNAASHLKMKDVSDAAGSEYLGWSDARMFRKYGSNNMEQAKRLANMLDFAALADGAKTVQKKKLGK